MLGKLVLSLQTLRHSRSATFVWKNNGRVKDGKGYVVEPFLFPWCIDMQRRVRYFSQVVVLFLFKFFLSF